MVCTACGAVAEVDSHLVSDQGFEESSSGRIVASGTRINIDQTHQKTYAKGAPREGPMTRQKSESEALRKMGEIASPKNIHDSDVKTAKAIFSLAYSNAFVRGRTIDSVAVVCLYLACRKATYQEGGVKKPKYAFMLIDFAETQNMDVFALGKMYRDLVYRLYGTAGGHLDPNESYQLLAHGPEVLIEKFVLDRHMDFPVNLQNKIKNDALNVVYRMNRDWMVQGRRPSGVAGAAVILAARMNNLRRTTREVVLIAKVTEITINKRLEEFHDTESSTLTVDDFRDDEIRNSIAEANPPSYDRAHNPKEKKRKRGRPKKAKAGVTAAEHEDDDDEDELDNNTAPSSQPLTKRARIDAEGFAIPDIPARAQLPPASSRTDTPDNDVQMQENETSSGTGTKKPGRRPGTKNWTAPPITAEEIALEERLARDVDEALALEDSRNTVGDYPDTRPPTSTNENTSAELPSSESINDTSESSSSTTNNNVRPRARNNEPPGPPVDGNIGNTGEVVSMSPTLKTTEFDDDLDVSACLLNEDEKKAKERIWVTENADWLRQSSAKRIKQQLKEAAARMRGDPLPDDKQNGAIQRRKDGNRKAGRAGDTSYLEDGEQTEEREGSVQADEEGGRPVRSTSQAVSAMLRTRAQMSRRINYNSEALAHIYSYDNDSSDRSRSQSRGPGDREGSVASQASTASSIFRANGSKAGGTGVRSVSSVAAEQRERKKKQARQASRSVTAETGASATSDRGSSSRSPSMATPTPGVEGEGEIVGTGASPAPPSPAGLYQHQLPTPAPTQAQQTTSNSSRAQQQLPTPTPPPTQSQAAQPVQPQAPPPLMPEEERVMDEGGDEIVEAFSGGEEDSFIPGIYDPEALGEDYDDDDDDEDDGDEDVEAAFNAGGY